MKVKKTNKCIMPLILVFTMLCGMIIGLSPFLSGTAAAQTAPSLQNLYPNPLPPLSPNGDILVSVLNGSNWLSAGEILCDQYLRETDLDLSDVLPASGPFEVKLTQNGGGAAQLDEALLGGLAPTAVNGSTDDTLGSGVQKLSQRDFDLIDLDKIQELTFPSGGSNATLQIVARIDSINIDEIPFEFPIENNYQDITTRSSFYNYTLGSVQGPLSLSETDTTPFFKQYCMPGTGHPYGYTYCWVSNDSTNLYAIIDFTPADTDNDGVDYTKLFFNNGSSVMQFLDASDDQQYGQALFTYTDKVNYQHEVFEIKVPFTAMGIDYQPGLQLPLAFAAFGTAALPPSFSRGSGTQSDPYQIVTPGDLSLVRFYETNPNNYYELMNNVDLSVYGQGYTSTDGFYSWTGWDPIGDDLNGNNYFDGHFYGNGHTISNLYINGSPGNLEVGGLFGYLDSSAVVDSVYLDNVGVNLNVGASNGALAGYNSGTITNCYATGSVSGNTSYSGGLVGFNSGSIAGCFATSSINGGGPYSGGLVGYNEGPVTGCYATGNVSGIGLNGGLVGLNSSTITGCYATGSIGGAGTLNGGLAGINVGSIADCYATGNVSGNDGSYNGGLVGKNTGESGTAFIADCYATGSVSSVGGSVYGGLVGENSNDGGYAYITDSYCLTANGQGAIGVDDGGPGPSGQPNISDHNNLTTAEMRTESTFKTDSSTPWDFTSTWGINDGYSYPYLQQVPPNPLSTVTASASGGTVNGISPYVGAYNVADAVYLIADPNRGYNFTNWSVGGTTVSGAVYTFNMPASNVSLTANFEGTLSAGATGTALPAGTVGTSYATGSITQYITASGGTAPYSYSADGLPGGLSMSASGEITGTPNAAFNGRIAATVIDNSNPQESVQVSLALVVNQAAPASYTISASVSPQGAGAVSGTGTFNAGSPVSLTATPNSGYAFSKWTDTSGNLVSVANPYAITSLESNITLVAVFNATTTSNNGGGGGNGVGYYPPVVQTEAASTVTASSAVLNGNITSGNGYSVTDYGFLWGTSSSSLTNKLDAGADNNSGAFTAALGSLTAGTTYYFEAYATNSQGTADGAVVNFTTLGITPAALVAPTFSDVPSTFWAHDAITSLSGLGYVSGYPDGTFKPGNPITRAEFVSIMNKVLKLSAYNPAVSGFGDVAPGDWYYASVENAVYAGIAKGYGNNTFAPGNPITREELACILVQALGQQNEAMADMNANTGFTDDASISSWARGFVVVAVKDGLLKGYPDGSFQPKRDATRAEACAMIKNFLGLYTLGNK